MGHLVAVAVAASTLGVLAACGPRPGPETADLAASRGPEGRRESAGAGGGDRGALAPETIEDVMWEKVVHAQALMLGVVRADYGLVQDSGLHGDRAELCGVPRVPAAGAAHQGVS
ncbi:MAG: hypothetical protein ACYTGE_13130 [Planctomycetota bacterium]|jgi:hypothetical protein